MRWWGICVCDNKCVYVNHLARWHLFNIYGNYSEPPLFKDEIRVT